MAHEFAREGLNFKYGKHIGINPVSVVQVDDCVCVVYLVQG